MSRHSKGPHLWLRPTPRIPKGSRPAPYFILDTGVQRSTGFGVEQATEAQQALDEYIASKYENKAATENRDPSVIPISDVLTLYLKDVVSARIKAIEEREGSPISDLDITRPDIKAALGQERMAAHRIKRLNAFFGSKMLVEVNGVRHVVPIPSNRKVSLNRGVTLRICVRPSIIIAAKDCAIRSSP